MLINSGLNLVLKELHRSALLYVSKMLSMNVFKLLKRLVLKLKVSKWGFQNSDYSYFCLACVIRGQWWNLQKPSHSSRKSWSISWYVFWTQCCNYLVNNWWKEQTQINSGNKVEFNLLSFDKKSFPFSLFHFSSISDQLRQKKNQNLY